MVSLGQVGAIVGITTLLGVGGAAFAASQVHVPTREDLAVATVGAPQVIIDDPDDLLSPDDEARMQRDAQRLDAPSTVKTLHYIAFNQSRENVNDTMEEFLRDNYPDQIEDNKYADGLLVIAAFTNQRQVGAYAGDDVNNQIRLDQRAQTVIDSMGDGMRDDNIPAAMFAGASTAMDAQQIENYVLDDASDDRLGAGLGGGVGFGALGLAASSTTVAVANSRRKAIAQAREDYGLVTREYAQLAQRLDEVDIRANSLRSAFADKEMRKQWAEVRDRFLKLHDTVSGAEGISRIDMEDDKDVLKYTKLLSDAAESVRHTSNAEDNINRLFAVENGDAAARRSDLTKLREDVEKARLNVKSGDLKNELQNLEARVNGLDQNPSDPEFVDKFVRVLGDYRVLLDVVKQREFSDVKGRNPLSRPAIYDNDYYYSGFVTFMVMNSWHTSNVQAAQSAQTSSGVNTSYSSGFSGAGGSGSY